MSQKNVWTNISFIRYNVFEFFFNPENLPQRSHPLYFLNKSLLNTICMIISHKYKYIFIKAVKVGGTSVELNLAKHCGPEDVITPLDAASERKDTTLYSHSARNYEGFVGHESLGSIKSKVSPEIWKKYFKFTIVRNPWDKVVSTYCWLNTSDKMRFSNLTNHEKVLDNIFNQKAYSFVLSELTKRAKSRLFKNFRPDDFDFFIKQMGEDNQTNKRFYFDYEGNTPCDAYLRYEKLEDGYKSVCEHLKIPYEKLPLTKNKIRKDRIPYFRYYNESSKQFVMETCKKEIERFGYVFGYE